MQRGPSRFLSDAEKQNMPKVTKELIFRILSYLKPYWKQFVLVFVAILLSAAIGLLPSIITGKIVDEALVGKDMQLLIKLLIAAFVTMTVSQVIGVLESYINAWISQRIIFDMKNQMYDHLQHMPHSFFTTEKQGDIVTRMNSDIGGVSSVISGTLTSIVNNIATVVTTLVALFTMSWQLALVGIVVIPLLILLPLYYVIREPLTYMMHIPAEISAQIVEAIKDHVNLTGNEFYHQLFAAKYLGEYSKEILAAYAIAGNISSQYISGLLFALPL